MLSGSDICVCVLFYGDDAFCHNLACRVFNGSFSGVAEQGVSFRFGLNAVSDKTKNLVYEKVQNEFANAFVFESSQNIYKYPMMRRMFYYEKLSHPYLIWFDDNSYILPDTDVENWLIRVKRQLTACDVVGSVYTKALEPGQVGFVSSQPWGNQYKPSPYIKYAAGAWWAAKTYPLLANNWPPPDLKHHGGDVIMGEFCRQRDLQLCHFRDGVAINVNSSGVEGGTHRRGFEATPAGLETQKK